MKEKVLILWLMFTFTPAVVYCRDRRKPIDINGNAPIAIATLLPFDNRRLFSRDRVAPAMEIAKNKVKEMQLLPHRNLSIKYADSMCNVADGMNEAINFYVRQEVDVFVGPCCDYAAAPVARQIRYWDIPMITAGAMARDFAIAKKQMFNLITRVGASFNSLVQALAGLVSHYEWYRVSLIYEPEGQRDIMDRYCHIAIDGVHYGFKTLLPELHQEYSKFDSLDDILSDFLSFMKRDNGGKYCMSFVY